jgi:putative endonuclease
LRASGKGKAGEERAARYLKTRGYQILATNYHGTRGEIDIVALKEQKICFVEVKAWDSFAIDSLEWAVNDRKKKRIIGAAKQFIMDHPRFTESEIGFDIVFLTRGLREIDHIKDAFGVING